MANDWAYTVRQFGYWLFVIIIFLLIFEGDRMMNILEKLVK